MCNRTYGTISPIILHSIIGYLVLTTTLLANSNDFIDNVRQVHDFSSEVRLQTDSPLTSTGQPYRDVSLFRQSLSSKFYATLAEDYKAHLHIKGYYDAIYDLNKHESDTEALKKAYRSELEIREAYLQGSLSDKLDFKIGRQIVNWGYADFLRVADNVNPVDQRELGLLDLEDSRLPIAITRLDYFQGDWRFNLNLLHEFEANRIAPFGSSFYPFDNALPDEKQTHYHLDNTGVALRLERNFSDADLAFFYSDRYRHDFNFTPDTSSLTGVSLQYDRIKYYGLAGQLQQGNWVFKAESAFTEGLGFFNSTDKKRRWDQLLGLEYQGWTDTQLSLEIQYSRLFDFDENLKLAPDFAEKQQTQGIASLRHSFAQDRWQAQALLYVSQDLGAFQRVSLEKTLNDQSSIRFGYVNYNNGSNPLASRLGENDTAFIKYFHTF